MENDSRIRTARKGVIAKNAIVPKLVEEIINKGIIKVNNVLDFGCGKDEYHIKLLQGKFPNIKFEGYDLGYDYPTTDKYDLIFASNVLNVQRTSKELSTTLQHLNRIQGSTSYLIINYPKNPRYINLTTNQIESILHFWWYPIPLLNSGTKVWQLCKNKNCQLVI